MAQSLVQGTTTCSTCHVHVIQIRSCIMHKSETDWMQACRRARARPASTISQRARLASRRRIAAGSACSGRRGWRVDFWGTQSRHDMAPIAAYACMCNLGAVAWHWPALPSHQMTRCQMSSVGSARLCRHRCGGWLMDKTMDEARPSCFSSSSPWW